MFFIMCGCDHHFRTQSQWVSGNIATIKLSQQSSLKSLDSVCTIKSNQLIKSHDKITTSFTPIAGMCHC